MRTVRAASPADARAIAEVHVASWRWAYESVLPPATLEALSVDRREAMWRGATEQPATRAAVLVAEDDGGGIVGFASTGPTADEGAGDGTGEVFAIYVEEASAGTGVGRELFEAAQERLRAAGFARATLWVLGANDRARLFYEKAGWTWDGTVSEHRFDCGNQPIVRYAADL